MQSRTSKCITDLLLPQTSLRYTYTVPPRSNRIRATPETFQQAEVSLVDGINQTTSLHQLRSARHHNTQRRTHQRQRRRNAAQHNVTTQQHSTQYPQKTTTTNTTTTTPANNSNSISNSNSFRNRNNRHVRRGSAPSVLSLYLYTVMKVTGHPLPLDNERKATSLRTDTSSCQCTIFSCPLMSVPTRVFRPTGRHMYRITNVSFAITNSESSPTENYICICFCN